MVNKTIPDEMCVEVGEMKQCMDGEYLIAAILLECCLYFFLFVFGVKIVDWVRKILRREKHGEPQIRQRLLQEKQR